MIVLRKQRIIDDFGELKDVKLNRIDYGVSFADYLGECEVEGHVLNRFGYGFNSRYNFKNEYLERCEICHMERDVVEYTSMPIIKSNGIRGYSDIIMEYGEWRKSTCAECEENCIINRPLEPQCPNCKSKNDSGIYHSNGNDELLFNCHECGKEDQVIYKTQ